MVRENSSKYNKSTTDEDLISETINSIVHELFNWFCYLVSELNILTHVNITVRENSYIINY